MSHPDLDLTVSPTCQCRFGGGASPAGTTSCVTAGGAQRNPWNNTAAPTGKSRRDGIMIISPLRSLGMMRGGLKARQSSAQGNALWHGRHLSTPEAPTGRNLFVRMMPRQDSISVARNPLFPESPLSSPRHPLSILPYFIPIQRKIREKGRGRRPATKGTRNSINN
jgi:hypothetical protein